jgi:hypothetical protein
MIDVLVYYAHIFNGWSLKQMFFGGDHGQIMYLQSGLIHHLKWDVNFGVTDHFRNLKVSK